MRFTICFLFRTSYVHYVDISKVINTNKNGSVQMKFIFIISITVKILMRNVMEEN